jgi:head-tail adaptor
VTNNLSARLRDRVQIRRKVRASDGKGGLTDPAWTTIATPFAEVVSQSGREALVAGAVQGIASYKVTMRTGTDVKTSDQLVFGAVTLNAKTIGPDHELPLEAIVVYGDTGSVQQ